MAEFDLYEDELDAARAAVKHLGGAKCMGPVFWPDKPVEHAARLMHDCLNPNRAERLSPSQVLLLMRKAREAGFHGLAEYFMSEAGYSRPVPVNAQTEAAILIKQIDTVLGNASVLAARLERIRGMESA